MPKKKAGSSGDILFDGLSQLTGATVVGAIVSGQGHHPYYGLLLDLKGQRLRLTFLRDDEGNGPGSYWLEDFDPTKG